jgi:HlyD family secretion protein
VAYGRRKYAWRAPEWERAITAANLAETTYKRINALYRDGLVSQQRNDEVDTAYRRALDVVKVARAHYDLALNGFRREERAAAAEVTAVPAPLFKRSER